jgi:DNA ligase (NAD+)
MEKGKLIKMISDASAAYYNTDAPQMSDTEFDGLIEKLRDIDPDHPLLYKVGARPMGRVYEHSIPAGSQEKLKDKNAYDKWIEQTRNHGCRRYAKGLKMDGLTIVLDFQDGKLTRALSRGDGFFGADLSSNVIQMKNVKKVLPVPFSGSLRGEMILAKSDFEKHFAPLGYTNPRNSASGVSSDQKGTGLHKHLKVLYFDCIGNDGSATEEESLRYMKDILGLDVVETEFFDDPESLWNVWAAMASVRDSLDFEIDGVVVRVNEIAIQNEMGSTSDLRPKSQRCLKFEAQGALTELLAVELSIGSNGAIVPTGKLNPVHIGGVTVSSALLSNFLEVQRLDIAVGDTVYVTRRGDVIPKIEHVVDRPANRQPIAVPDTCIVCGAKTEMVGAYLLCTNDLCVGTEFRRLLKYVSKRNIKFLGEETLAELYENHAIKTPPDLYTLTEEYLRNVTKGKGSIVGEGAKVIIAEIDKSRTVQLKDLLGCLAIPMLGRRQTEIIINLGIDSIEKFLDLKVEELVQYPGFKDAKATAIVNGIQAARPLIDKMCRILTLTATTKKEVTAMQESKLSGKQFCFTGAIEKLDGSGKRFTRDMMHSTVLANGGTVTDTVGKATILVQADVTSVSSKSKKAAKIGATIMAEQEFWKLVA